MANVHLTGAGAVCGVCKGCGSATGQDVNSGWGDVAVAVADDEVSAGTSANTVAGINSNVVINILKSKELFFMIFCFMIIKY